MLGPTTWAIVGILLTIATLVANVTYRSGHLSARVEELERWRTDVRKDMHEISDKMEDNHIMMTKLYALVEERTERRANPRPPKGSNG